jgi:hypothetical protein
MCVGSCVSVQRSKATSNRERTLHRKLKTSESGNLNAKGKGVIFSQWTIGLVRAEGLGWVGLDWVHT